ncbi:MAG: AraC family transcriptional regulator [Bacteroides sp.]|nr:AraC family transcriptional regulator [Bacteroides sp.]
MKYIASILLVIMTVGLVICGILLWKRRRETGDYSRTIQALFSWVSAFFAGGFIVRTWSETTTVDSTFLAPEHTFVPILVQVLFFFYPLEVIRPIVSRAKVYTLLFAPLLLMVFIGICMGIDYTPLYTLADVWQHLGEFNVWFRLFTLVVMLFYGFSLFLVPYDWRRSSADRKFIMAYALGFCLLGVLHFFIQFSHAYVLVLIHQVVWMAFFFGVAYYELCERLIVAAPNKPVAPEEKEIFSDSHRDELWERIVQIIEDNEGWRNPELNMTFITTQLFSNRTYVSEAFKRNTGMTFSEYITKRRIDYVAEELRRRPESNIQDLFIDAGYRHRSTAWRHFHKLKGISPSDYLESLK